MSASRGGLLALWPFGGFSELPQQAEPLEEVRLGLFWMLDPRVKLVRNVELLAEEGEEEKEGCSDRTRATQSLSLARMI